MLSKEEIEKAKECLQETIQNTYSEGKAIKLNNVLKYIDQLESDKQKLIEKLEEDVKIFGNYEERKQMAKEQLYENDGKWFYCQEILSILKGE